jgi:hypothetical protein
MSLTKVAGSGSGSVSQRHESADPDPNQMSWIPNTGRNSTGTGVSVVTDSVKDLVRGEGFLGNLVPGTYLLKDPKVRLQIH